MGNGSQSKAAWKRQAATIAHTKKQHIIKQQKINLQKNNTILFCKIVLLNNKIKQNNQNKTKNPKACSTQKQKISLFFSLKIAILATANCKAHDWLSLTGIKSAHLSTFNSFQNLFK